MKNTVVLKLITIESYSDDDLDGTDIEDSRVLVEHENESKGEVEFVSMTVDN